MTARPVAIGAMRLSTATDADEARAAAVLDAALAAGVTLLDTADVYGRDATDTGHNERLVAAAVARHAAAPGAAPVTVVTKGGLIRDGLRWRADGRAVHLAAAARASRARLGALDLYLLHAPDPRTPLATSVRALAALRADGVVARVGLANVGRAQLEEALAIVDVAAVQVELGLHDLAALRGGLVARCAAGGILVLAHRPLGGPARAQRLARDVDLAAIAARHGATAAEVALAWLRDLAPVIVPLPGPSTAATAASAVRAATLALDDDARATLDRRFLDGGAARVGGAPARPAPVAARADGREVVILMGMPGAGKSTLAGALVARGHVRFNRDERGGTLDALARALDAALAEGAPAAVLDNTYATRALRAPVIDVARRHGLPARCVWLDTSIEDAQVNAAARLVARYDRLPEPGELRTLAKRDPGAFQPGAQFRWRRELEPPAADEGFAAIERVPFARAAAIGAGGRPALLVELALIPEVAAALGAWAAAGWTLAATAWQPAAAAGAAGAEVTAAAAAALLGRPLEVATCTHGAGPPVCWCRKPLPGLGLVLARRLGLDLGRSVCAGRGAADRGFAARLGMRFVDVDALATAVLAVD